MPWVPIVTIAPHEGAQALLGKGGRSRLTTSNGNLDSRVTCDFTDWGNLTGSCTVDVVSWLFIAAVVAFTLTAAVCDFRTKKIPNRLTVPAFAAALVYHGAVGAWTGGWGGCGSALLMALGGFGVGFGILLVLWLIGGGGAGDVKLMGAVGAWLGPWNTLVVFLVSTVFIVLLSVGFLMYQLIAAGMSKTKSRYLSAEENKTNPSRGTSTVEAAAARKVRRRLLPFGVPVALATWIVLVWSFREQLFTH